MAKKVRDHNVTAKGKSGVCVVLAVKGSDDQNYMVEGGDPTGDVSIPVRVPGLVVAANPLVPFEYDEILVDTTTSPTEDVYVYRLATVVVAVITVNYSDAGTKLVITSVVRS